MIEPRLIVESAIVLSVIGLIYKIMQDCKANAELIFRRFDEYKESVKKDHVSKDVCKIIHEQLSSDLKEIKADVKEIMRVQRNGGK